MSIRKGDTMIAGQYVPTNDNEALTTNILVSSGGYVRAYRSGSLALISFCDFSYTYTGGATAVATVTLPTGWKVYINDAGVYSFISGEMSGSNANGIKVWATGKDTNVITLSVWATSGKTITQGAGQIIVPIYKG